MQAFPWAKNLFITKCDKDEFLVVYVDKEN